jgi:hypothetical protein
VGIKKHKCRECGDPCHGLRCLECYTWKGTNVSTRRHGLKHYHKNKVGV